jgi:hypothetical protein
VPIEIYIKYWRHPSVFFFSMSAYIFTDPVLQHSSILDNEAFIVLDVARAQQEVCRAEQSLVECLADHHTAVARLYQVQARSLGNLMDPLELNVRMIRAAMRQRGLDEPFPDFSTSSTQPGTRTSLAATVQKDPDGM